ncbi:transposase [Pelagibius sp.]|uniref:transposase n=1 Tax=Pelagibius sp. TaxID=1931238 RepID=UPI003BAE7B51
MPHGQTAEVVAALKAKKLSKAPELVESYIAETFRFNAFPDQHWIKLKTNNSLERIVREIQRRSRVVGIFPERQSALNLAAAKLRYIADTKWSLKRYINMDLLKQHRGTT